MTNGSPGREARDMYKKHMVDIQINDFLNTNKSPGPIYKQQVEDFELFKVPKYDNARAGKQGHHRSHTQVMDLKANGVIKRIKDNLVSMIKQMSLTEKERMGISQNAGSSTGFNNATLEKVLKKANLLTATDLQYPEQISNETLWNIFTLYQIEKGHQKE